MKTVYAIGLILVLSAWIFSSSCVYTTVPVAQTYQETQYRTETTSEKYTENVTTIHPNSGEYELPCYFTWHTSTFNYYGYDIPDWAAYDNISLRLTLWPQLQPEPAVLRVFDMSKTGQIPSPEPLTSDEPQEQYPNWYLITGTASPSWLQSANTMINQAKLLGAAGDHWPQAGAEPQTIVLKAGKPSNIAIIITGSQNRWNNRATVDVLWTINTIDSREIAGERQVTRRIPYQVQKERTVYQVRQIPFWETLFSRK